MVARMEMKLGTHAYYIIAITTVNNNKQIAPVTFLSNKSPLLLKLSNGSTYYEISLPITCVSRGHLPDAVVERVVYDVTPLQGLVDQFSCTGPLFHQKCLVVEPCHRTTTWFCLSILTCAYTFLNILHVEPDKSTGAVCAWF